MLSAGRIPSGRIPLGGIQNEADAALRFAYGPAACLPAVRHFLNLLPYFTVWYGRGAAVSLARFTLHFHSRPRHISPPGLNRLEARIGSRVAVKRYPRVCP